MTEGLARTANRAMLRAVGFSDEDFRKPIVGFAVADSDVSPCNVHLWDIAKLSRSRLEELGAKGMTFHTFVVTDGEAMGHEGMKASLVSRDVIADIIELAARGHAMDALLGVGGCDKTIPGTVMGLARYGAPAVFVYGGTIRAGRHRGKAVDIVSAFEAVGAYGAGLIDEAERHAVECAACPGPGACGGMYTANTMASAMEALGMSVPGSASVPAVSPEREAVMVRSAEALALCMERNLVPADIMTRRAFENAIRVVMAVGGSTNAVLHLLALAREVDVDLSIDDFNRFSDTTPILCDMKPAGRYVMEDLHEVGGIPLVMRMLLDRGLLHGDCLTVTGRTVAENLEGVRVSLAGQAVVKPFEAPEKATGPIVVLKGNLAPEGAVLKTCGLDADFVHSGPARVFENEEAALAAILEGRIGAGDVVVIRYEGPAGGAGHAGDAVPHLRHRGGRAYTAGGPDHGRTLLRGQPRHGGGPRGAGSPGRGAHSPAQGGGHDHHRQRGKAPPGGSVPGGAGEAPRLLVPAAAQIRPGRPGEIRPPGVLRLGGGGHQLRVGARNRGGQFSIFFLVI